MSALVLVCHCVIQLVCADCPPAVYSLRLCRESAGVCSRSPAELLPCVLLALAVGSKHRWTDLFDASSYLNLEKLTHWKSVNSMELHWYNGTESMESQSMCYESKMSSMGQRADGFGRLWPMGEAGDAGGMRVGPLCVEPADICGASAIVLARMDLRSASNCVRLIGGVRMYLSLVIEQQMSI